jgi:predicted GNAT family N-acyltransferase
MTQNPLSAKMDHTLSVLEPLNCVPAFTKASLEEAAEMVALISAGGDRNKAVVVTIPIPMPFAARFPSGEHEPHITVCFVTKDDIDAGMYSQITAAVRRAARQVAPFRVFVDVGAGLKDFGDGPNGSKALWFEVLSADENGAKNDPLGRLFKAIRSALEAEGLPCEAHDTFKGHTTWVYVPNEQTIEERTAMSVFAASRFNDAPLGFAVRQVVLSSPDGKKTLVTLNPQAPKVKGSMDDFDSLQVDKVMSRLKKRHSLSWLSYNINTMNDGTNTPIIRLKVLEVPEDRRGEGVGTKAMTEIVALADKVGAVMALNPEGASWLPAFYAKFGFQKNTGQFPEVKMRMVRAPQMNRSTE